MRGEARRGVRGMPVATAYFWKGFRNMFWQALGGGEKGGVLGAYEDETHRGR